nr:TolC family protein [Novosphingobium sp.]
MPRPLPLLLLGSALVSACATGPAYEPPQAGALAVPALYAGQSEAQSPARLQDWWKQFGDARLDSLIDRGLAGNLDLAIARARLVQARESLVQSRGGRLPTVSGSGQASQGLDTSGGGQSAFSLGIDASWEADLFGGKARAVEASRAEAQAAAYDLAAVRVSLVSDIATYYVQARLAQQRLALARQNLGFADENLQIARWRNQAGLVTSIDVEQARSARAQIAVTLPTLEQTYGQAVFRLGV